MLMPIVSAACHRVIFFAMASSQLAVIAAEEWKDRAAPATHPFRGSALCIATAYWFCPGCFVPAAKFALNLYCNGNRAATM